MYSEHEIEKGSIIIPPPPQKEIDRINAIIEKYRKENPPKEVTWHRGFKVTRKPS